MEVIQAVAILALVAIIWDSNNVRGYMSDENNNANQPVEGIEKLTAPDSVKGADGDRVFPSPLPTALTDQGVNWNSDTIEGTSNEQKG